MFGVYLRTSIWAIIWLFLIPFVVFFIIYNFFVNPLLQTFTGGHGYNLFFRQGIGTICIFISMGLAFIFNFLFLVLIPGTIRPLESKTKRNQFYIGFYSNLILMFAIPVIYMLIFGFNWQAGLVFALLHGFGFLFPFILGANFICPAYANKFWFKDRVK